MDGYIVSATLGAAMELGIFWLLANKPLPATDVAQCFFSSNLGYPIERPLFAFQAGKSVYALRHQSGYPRSVRQSVKCVIFFD